MHIHNRYVITVVSVTRIFLSGIMDWYSAFWFHIRIYFSLGVILCYVVKLFKLQLSVRRSSFSIVFLTVHSRIERGSEI